MTDLFKKCWIKLNRKSMVQPWKYKLFHDVNRSALQTANVQAKLSASSVLCVVLFYPRWLGSGNKVKGERTASLLWDRCHWKNVPVWLWVTRRSLPISLHCRSASETACWSFCPPHPLHQICQYSGVSGTQEGCKGQHTQKQHYIITWLLTGETKLKGVKKKKGLEIHVMANHKQR